MPIDKIQDFLIENQGNKIEDENKLNELILFSDEIKGEIESFLEELRNHLDKAGGTGLLGDGFRKKIDSVRSSLNDFESGVKGLEVDSKINGGVVKGLKDISRVICEIKSNPIFAGLYVNDDNKDEGTVKKNVSNPVKTVDKDSGSVENKDGNAEASADSVEVVSDGKQKEKATKNKPEHKYSQEDYSKLVDKKRRAIKQAIGLITADVADELSEKGVTKEHFNQELDKIMNGKGLILKKLEELLGILKKSLVNNNVLSEDEWELVLNGSDYKKELKKKIKKDKVEVKDSKSQEVNKNLIDEAEVLLGRIKKEMSSSKVYGPAMRKYSEWLDELKEGEKNNVDDFIKQAKKLLDSEKGRSSDDEETPIDVKKDSVDVENEEKSLEELKAESKELINKIKRTLDIRNLQGIAGFVAEIKTLRDQKYHDEESLINGEQKRIRGLKKVYRNILKAKHDVLEITRKGNEIGPNRSGWDDLSEEQKNKHAEIMKWTQDANIKNMSLQQMEEKLDDIRKIDAELILLGQNKIDTNDSEIEVQEKTIDENIDSQNLDNVSLEGMLNSDPEGFVKVKNGQYEGAVIDKLDFKESNVLSEKLDKIQKEIDSLLTRSGIPNFRDAFNFIINGLKKGDEESEKEALSYFEELLEKIKSKIEENGIKLDKKSILGISDKITEEEFVSSTSDKQNLDYVSFEGMVENSDPEGLLIKKEMTEDEKIEKLKNNFKILAEELIENDPSLISIIDSIRKSEAKDGEDDIESSLWKRRIGILKNIKNDPQGNVESSLGFSESDIDEGNIEIINGVEVISQDILDKFDDFFGISQKDFEQIQGFDKLSEGQQLLVLENLKQLALGRVQDEALEKYQSNLKRIDASVKEVVKKHKIQFVKNSVSNAWSAITKRFKIVKHEKEALEKVDKGGVDVYGQALQGLVDGIKDSGLDIQKDKNGNLEIGYFNSDDFENLDESGKSKIVNFNKIANKFGKIPYEWSLDTATRAEKKEFKKIKKEYEAAKQEVFLLKQAENSEKETALFMNERELKIELNRFLSNHPDVDKELQSIKSPLAWGRALSGIVTEKGVALGLGYASKSLAASLLTTYGAPIAAAVMGGVRARGRAKEHIRETKKMSRRGVEDKQFKTAAEDYVDAEYLHESIEFLISDLENNVQNTEPNQKRLSEAVKSLRFHLEDAQNKIEDGTVNFGNENEAAYNKYQLINKISQGLAAAQGVDFMFENDLEGIGAEYKEDLEAIQGVLEKRLEESSSRESWHKNWATMKGAAISAGFFVAGRYIRGRLFGGKVADVDKNDVGLSRNNQIIDDLKTIKDDLQSNVESKALELTEEAKKVFSKLGFGEELVHSIKNSEEAQAVLTLYDRFLNEYELSPKLAVEKTLTVLGFKNGNVDTDGLNLPIKENITNADFEKQYGISKDAVVDLDDDGIKELNEVAAAQAKELGVTDEDIKKLGIKRPLSKDKLESLMGIEPKLVGLLMKNKDLDAGDLNIARSRISDNLKYTILEDETRSQGVSELMKNNAFATMEPKQQSSLLENILGAKGGSYNGKIVEQLSKVQDFKAGGELMDAVKSGKVDDVANVVGKYNAAFDDVKQGDNLTKVARRLLVDNNTTSEEVKGAFAKKYLSNSDFNSYADGTDEIKAGLIAKAIDRMSISNIKMGDGDDVQNLIYEGNKVGINSETGEIFVEKGSGAHEAQSVDAARFRPTAKIESQVEAVQHESVEVLNGQLEAKTSELDSAIEGIHNQVDDEIKGVFGEDYKTYTESAWVYGDDPSNPTYEDPISQRPVSDVLNDENVKPEFRDYLKKLKSENTDIDDSIAVDDYIKEAKVNTDSKITALRKDIGGINNLIYESRIVEKITGLDALGISDSEKQRVIAEYLQDGYTREQAERVSGIYDVLKSDKYSNLFDDAGKTASALSVFGSYDVDMDKVLGIYSKCHPDSDVGGFLERIIENDAKLGEIKMNVDQKAMFIDATQVKGQIDSKELSPVKNILKSIAGNKDISNLPVEASVGRDGSLDIHLNDRGFFDMKVKITGGENGISVGRGVGMIEFKNMAEAQTFFQKELDADVLNAGQVSEGSDTVAEAVESEQVEAPKPVTETEDVQVEAPEVVEENVYNITGDQLDILVGAGQTPKNVAMEYGEGVKQEMVKRHIKFMPGSLRIGKDEFSFDTTEIDKSPTAKIAMSMNSENNLVINIIDEDGTVDSISVDSNGQVVNTEGVEVEGESEPESAPVTEQSEAPSVASDILKVKVEAVSPEVKERLKLVGFSIDEKDNSFSVAGSDQAIQFDQNTESVRLDTYGETGLKVNAIDKDGSSDVMIWDGKEWTEESPSGEIRGLGVNADPVDITNKDINSSETIIGDTNQGDKKVDYTVEERNGADFDTIYPEGLQCSQEKLINIMKNSEIDSNKKMDILFHNVKPGATRSISEDDQVFCYNKEGNLYINYNGKPFGEYAKLTPDDLNNLTMPKKVSMNPEEIWQAKIDQAEEGDVFFKGDKKFVIQGGKMVPSGGINLDFSEYITEAVPNSSGGEVKGTVVENPDSGQITDNAVDSSDIQKISQTEMNEILEDENANSTQKYEALLRGLSEGEKKVIGGGSFVKEDGGIKYITKNGNKTGVNPQNFSDFSVESNS